MADKQGSMKVTNMKVGDVVTPAHLVRYYEEQGNNHKEALEKAQSRMQIRNKEIGEGALAVRLRTHTIDNIVESTEQQLAEVTMAPETRSTPMQITTKEIAEFPARIILLNRLTERDAQGSTESETVKQTKQKCKACNKTLLLLDTKASRGCTSVISMQIGRTNLLENPLSPGEPHKR